MTITVDFSQLHPAASATWTAIARLVASTNIQTWAVVGGQMVAIPATVVDDAVTHLESDRR